jgi:hypothetical protein
VLLNVQRRRRHDEILARATLEEQLIAIVELLGRHVRPPLLVDVAPDVG